VIKLTPRHLWNLGYSDATGKKPCRPNIQWHSNKLMHYLVGYRQGGGYLSHYYRKQMANHRFLLRLRLFDNNDKWITVGDSRQRPHDYQIGVVSITGGTETITVLLD